mmetsp:Transcript_537/g.706  ORF Transcript_537/g.706 Transcript_537/m.706 type:complete len:151 (-) Transcript_537:85-537(-)|eukprot:CAMPEP_0114225444 /NCGR_PEP_ID=MMETSP0058-20121206/671_1 /TAXON_ID=36894 /ORGANISM="Pyramimonas parkeae, CCMP726" /LENGTH=150 /DNA_ID=CAMNT_0001336041 /DNA_START=95 /DNA_END=547 /DNA_ORIENTATION=-
MAAIVASTTFLAKAAPKAAPKQTKTVAVFSAEKLGKAAASTALALTLATSANAATIKLGSDSGALVFEPATATVAAGEKITFVNNRGFPHNVVFDEDAIPAGVDADAISHEDYLNGPGDEVSNTFDTPGEYGYYCEPHQGAGMVGKIIVK